MSDIISGITPDLLGSADPKYIQTIVIYKGTAYRVTGWDGQSLNLVPFTYDIATREE